MKIVCISDTHNSHWDIPDIPDGDILIHAGDITSRGELECIKDFNDWLGTIPIDNKIVIAGNHDFCFEGQYRDHAESMLSNCTYLQDSGCEIDGLNIWGTPWQPWFYDWAFNINEESDRKKKWDLIPDNTDVLVVHGPPNGHGDLTKSGVRTGCVALLDKIVNSNIKLVVTGHIHEDYGIHEIDGTKIVNASVLNLNYDVANEPIVIEL